MANKPAIEYSKIAQEKYITEKSANVQKVFLIFGALHNFSQECREFKYNLTEITFLKEEANFVETVTPSIFGLFNMINTQFIEKEIVNFPLEDY